MVTDLILNTRVFAAIFLECLLTSVLICTFGNAQDHSRLTSSLQSEKQHTFRDGGEVVSYYKYLEDSEKIAFLDRASQVRIGDPPDRVEQLIGKPDEDDDSFDDVVRPSYVYRTLSYFLVLHYKYGANALSDQFVDFYFDKKRGLIQCSCNVPDSIVERSKVKHLGRGLWVPSTAPLPRY